MRSSGPEPCAAHVGRCSKHGVLRRYPFYLAYENSNDADYVTEKVFDALESGVLPVYYGAPNVDDFVPPGAPSPHTYLPLACPA